MGDEVEPVISTPAPKEGKRSFGGPVRVVLATLIIFFLSQFIAALIIGIYLGFHHTGAKLSFNIDQSAPVQFFYVLFAESLAAWLAIKIVQKRGLGLAAIGLGRAPRWLDVIRAILGAGSVYLALIAVSILVRLVFPHLDVNQAQDVGFARLNSSIDSILAFISLVILPPIGEEILVRGYLYSGLRSKMRFVPAMLITSVLFGLAHLTSGSGGATIWIAAIDTFVLSLVLVYLREKTGALYACMLVHALNNLIAFGVHFHG